MGAIARRPTDEYAIVGVVDPDVLVTTTTHDTDTIDMSLWDSVSFIVSVGTFGTAAALDFVVRESAASDMSSPSNISGKAITQLVDGDDDKQAIVNVRSDELSAGMRYIDGRATVGTETIDGTIIALGFHPRYAPAKDNDLGSVDEIVDG